MILHIDMDAFFASIEQAVNPRLKGLPLIVGSRTDKWHTVVCAASYEAKRLGIDSGMSSAEALRICPQAHFVAADQSRYIWTSQELYGMLKAYGMPLAYASIDEFQMDIAENEPLGLAEQIRRQIMERFSITASVGIAKNFLLAKLASKLRKPDGVTLITAENLEPVLAETPAEKLCGIGKKSGETLAHHGIKTCLELYRSDPWRLQQLFGKNGLSLYQALHQTEVIEDSATAQKPKSIGHSYTLPRASQNPGFIEAWIRLLSEMVGRRLREKNLVAHSLHLWLNGPQIGSFGAQKTFETGTNDGAEIFFRAGLIMAQKAPQSPKIRALGVTCGKLLEVSYEPLFESQKRREASLKTMDKINNRYGENTIFPAVIMLAKD